MISEVVGGLIQNLEAAYKFLVLITRDSPIGLWSMIGALTLPVVLGAWLRRIVPKMPKYADWRGLFIELSMLGSGVAIAYLPWRELNGMLVGIVGGLASTIFWRGAEAIFVPLWVFTKRKLGVDDVKLQERDLDIHWQRLSPAEKAATISDAPILVSRETQIQPES